MGRDTIQLETAFSTISSEYLLEFTFEYDISEDLHPELPGPGDRIVDFPKGKVGVYTKFFEFANFRIPISQFLFDILSHYQIHLSQLSVIGAAKVKTGTRPRVAHEVPLLTVTSNRVIEMEDPVAALTSSKAPSVMEKSPLDFLDEDHPPAITNKGETENQVQTARSQEVPSARNIATTEIIPEIDLEKETAAMGPPTNKKCRKRDQSAVEANAPPKILRKDHASLHPAQNIRGGKSIAAMGSGPER
ncbi:hypothetical protein Tco_0872919 [Tanacetum coccineum]